MTRDEKEKVSQAMSIIGRLGGKTKTPRKAEASRNNGKKHLAKPNVKLCLEKEK